MEPQQLNAFLSVAKHGSFSEAGAALFLTQPAVSKRIAALESQLDVRLFDRIGRRVILTEAGRKLRPQAEKILEAIAESKRVLQNLDQTISGKLSVGTSHHIGLHHLPPILKRFIQQYPQVSLDLQFMDSEQACQKVLNGDLELAFVTLPESPRDKLHFENLLDDPLDLVIAKDHPVLQHGKLDLITLSQIPAILPAVGTFTRSIIDHGFKQRQLKINNVMESNFMETIKTLVEVGLGWSALPHSLLSPQLHIIEENTVNLHRSLGLVQHTQRTLSNAAKVFVEEVRK